MILGILNIIVIILKLIYSVIITYILYLFNYNKNIINSFLENLNVYGTSENLEKYYDFKKNHTNGVALFNHTSYLDGIIIANEFNEPPSFVCSKSALVYKAYNIAKNWNCLIIEPKQNNAEKITNNILKRNKNEPLLVIAPTGPNLEQLDKNKLEDFKTGAFITLSPILPIIITYNKHIYVKNTEHILESFINLLNNNELYYKLKILDPIYPDKDDNIQSFKKKVYDIMNNEKNKIIVKKKHINLDINKKLIAILIILIILSFFIFSKQINIYLSLFIISSIFIILILRNKNCIYSYFYKNIIYIYSLLISIYSIFTNNYLLFINSIIYPFIYNFLKK